MVVVFFCPEFMFFIFLVKKNEMKYKKQSFFIQKNHCLDPVFSFSVQWFLCDEGFRHRGLRDLGQGIWSPFVAVRSALRKKCKQIQEMK